MASMLESAMDELFVPYTEGQRYLEVEVRSLGELYSSYLSMFTKYHVGLPELITRPFLTLMDIL